MDAETTNLQPGDVAELPWSRPWKIDAVALMENLVDGQKIAQYFLEAWSDGQWKPLSPASHFASAQPPFNSHPGFETIGHKKIDRVEPIVTDRIRFRCLKSVAQPVELRRLAVFHCEEGRPPVAK